MKLKLSKRVWNWSKNAEGAITTAKYAVFSV